MRRRLLFPEGIYTGYPWGALTDLMCLGHPPISGRSNSAIRGGGIWIMLPTVQTWVEIFVPEDSLPVASVARTRPDHTSDVSASSGDLHAPQQHHYSSY